MTEPTVKPTEQQYKDYLKPVTDAKGEVTLARRTGNAGEAIRVYITADALAKVLAEAAAEAKDLAPTGLKPLYEKWQAEKLIPTNSDR